MRKAYLAMIRAFPGGWDAMAAALGMSRMGLENRIYERKGQALLAETAMVMQELSGTTHYAEEVARESGGVFCPIQSFDGVADMELLDSYMNLVTDDGKLAVDFKAAIADGKITREEYERLRDDIRNRQAHEMEFLARLENMIVSEE